MFSFSKQAQCPATWNMGQSCKYMRRAKRYNQILSWFLISQPPHYYNISLTQVIKISRDKALHKLYLRDCTACYRTNLGVSNCSLNKQKIRFELFHNDQQCALPQYYILFLRLYRFGESSISWMDQTKLFFRCITLQNDPYLLWRSFVYFIAPLPSGSWLPKYSTNSLALHSLSPLFTPHCALHWLRHIRHEVVLAWCAVVGYS